MKNIILMTVLGIAIFIPSVTQAFDVTDRSMTKLSETLTMYTITFDAGFLNADLWVPLAATYEKSDDDKNGKVYSVVLSTALLDSERMYQVPKKQRGEFMLVVFEDVPPGVERSKTLTINDIPHQIKREGEERMKRSLTKEELKAFAVARN